jgi:hypothetical protein
VSGRLLAGVLVVVAAAVVGGALVILGPPSEERARQLDERRVEGLRQLSQSARIYYGRHQQLPSSTGELVSEGGARLATRDPASGEPYAYRVVDGRSFEVCATFDRPSEDRAIEFWSHAAGRQCFTQKVDDPK